MKSYFVTFFKFFLLPLVIFSILEDIIYLTGIAQGSSSIYFIFFYLSFILNIVFLGISLGKIYSLYKKIDFWKSLLAAFTSIVLFGIINLLLTFIYSGGGNMTYALENFLITTSIHLLIALYTLIFAGFALVYKKANQPWWAILVPIYNLIVLCNIGKKPGWWVVLIILIPIVNIVFLIMLWNGVAKNFGKSEGFTVGIVFLPFIFIPILGYGDAQYVDNTALNQVIPEEQ